MALSNRKRDEILRMYDQGYSYRVIGEELELRLSTVERVVDRYRPYEADWSVANHLKPWADKVFESCEPQLVGGYIVAPFIEEWCVSD